MYPLDPHETLALAQRHGDRLRAEAAAERIRTPSHARRALAASLRGAADRLDHASLARTPAAQS